MGKIVECGVLSMYIHREKGAEKSQRLINALLEAKRDNQNITTSELNYLAQGFKASNR